MIADLAPQVRDHQSRIRPISTGDLYRPPPVLQGHPPSSEESFERWRDRLSLLPLPLKKALQQTYQGISPPLARQLAGQQLNTPVNELTSSAWQALHQRWREWLDSLNAPLHHLVEDGDGGYSIHVVPSSDLTVTASSAQADLALQLGNWYRERLDRRELNRTCQELIQRLQRWKTKELSALSDQRNRLAACAESESLQQKADALLCLPRPSRDEVDQAQKLYRRARKLRRSATILEERIAHHTERLDLISGSEAFIEDLQAAAWQDMPSRIEALTGLKRELEDLLNPVGRQGQHRQQQHTPQPLEIRSPSGLSIQVGRNHRQNEWISLRQARSGDLWFHAQECPGSHVVLKSSAALAEEDDLQLACDLAAYFSRARGNVRVAVVMVATEQLQRIAGAAPGTVRHSGGEVRWGDPQNGEAELRRCNTPTLARRGA